MVYIKKLVTVLYFSIINVYWLLNLCEVGGDASFVPQANLVQCTILRSVLLVVVLKVWEMLMIQSSVVMCPH